MIGLLQILLILTGLSVICLIVLIVLERYFNINFTFKGVNRKKKKKKKNRKPSYRGHNNNTIVEVECIKSLYKSTYKNNLFTKGKIYQLTKIESNFGRGMVWVRSDENVPRKNIPVFLPNNSELETPIGGCHSKYKFEDHFRVIENTKKVKYVKPI